MNDFLHAHLQKNPEVTPHITLYLFKNRAPRVDVVALIKKMEIQSKNISHMENTCKELRLRVDLLTDKENLLGNK